MEYLGELYPNVGIMDWKRILNAYTPMVRRATKQPTAITLELQQKQMRMAAEGEE